ncbi:hypothetical protein [Nostoc sp. CHAB 5715]|uniref:hypothetical protein n=1 Tax=Nostoc sp. CHAB 5715 TaxID=2780400 RepID=UPI001E549B50|nr:hypothetical protein [Nostoc sp. CHAB 5715]MCC5621797.1 hypothetical protein [Nostoc sp. CHAB 5715]
MITVKSLKSSDEYLNLVNSDCLKSQAIVNKKPEVGGLTQLRNAALDSAVSGTG